MSKLRRKDFVCEACYLQMLLGESMGKAAFNMIYWVMWAMWIMNLGQRSVWENVGWGAATFAVPILMYYVVGFTSFLMSVKWAHRLATGSSYGPKAIDRRVEFWEKVDDRFGFLTWPWGVAWILGLIWARSFSWSTARA